ncbi:hypothetical protein [Pseudomonas sp. O11]|uniref:hypothetical protein n=1 Tax=Pseudomonas sp. O11 TaxID=3159446 RepID=UPI00387A9016
MGSITDHNQLLAWVASLDIPEASGVKSRSRSVVARANAEDEGAAVVRGSITSFVTGLSQQARDDVQNSTLLMQLAADKKFNPESNGKSGSSSIPMALLTWAGGVLALIIRAISRVTPMSPWTRSSLR